MPAMVTGLKDLYQSMVLIREAEETVLRLFSRQFRGLGPSSRAIAAACITSRPGLAAVASLKDQPGWVKYYESPSRPA
jgi:hypothetical protein